MWRSWWGGGAVNGGMRVISLWLECTAAPAHTQMHTHTVTQLSMQGLHRSFWKCSETSQIYVTQQWKFASSCLSALSAFYLSWCHFHLIFSFPLRLPFHRLTFISASLFSSQYTDLFTVFVSLHVYLSAGSSSCDRLCRLLSQTHSMECKVKQKHTVMGLKDRW